MKKPIIILLLAILGLSLVMSGCTPPQTVRDIVPISLEGGGENMLAPEELFEAVAITVTNEEKVQYVFGDNISGYYEGYTYGYKKGVGYIMKSTSLYHDFGSYTGGEVNDRTEASEMKIYPYGIRSVYEEGVWDEFLLHNKEYAVSVTVHSDSPQIQTLVPLMNYTTSKAEVVNMGNVIVLRFENPPDVEYPTYCAISANQLFKLTEGNFNKEPELKSVFKLKSQMIKPVFTTQEEVTDFTLFIAFGFTEEEAVQKADDMANIDSVTIQKQKIYDFMTESYLWTDDPDFNSALMWSKLAGYSLVSEEFGWGIWAGLSWFKDNWGRDTFIALPGILLVTGQFDMARDVMTNFSTFQNKGSISVEVAYEDDDVRDEARTFFKDRFDSSIAYRSGNMFPSISMSYVDKMDEVYDAITELTNSVDGLEVTVELVISENFGRIPNRVASMDNVIYNTTDGTPWFIREVYDYIRYTGNEGFAADIYPVVKLALEGSISNYADENGFLTHDDADTWMDARISGAEPWSARGTRAVEIQTLWYTALNIGAYLAEYNGESETAAKWTELADTLKDNFTGLFWDSRNKIMADRVLEDDTPDYRIRPNQLMLISVPFENRLISDSIEANVMKNAVSSLLYPYGIASLNQEDPFFHPYHENWDYYNKDAAYHNGTVWGWNAGPTVTAMTRFGYTELAYELTENLSHQILYQGCRGSMSEVMDALQNDYEDLNLTGTYSQAWSVSEFARNGYQDYAGFRPNLLDKEIDIVPAIPDKWTEFSGSFAFDTAASFKMEYSSVDGSQQFEIAFEGYEENLVINFALLKSDKSRRSFSLELAPGETKTVVFNPVSGTATVDGASVSTSQYLASYASTIGELEFVEPDFDRDYEMLMSENMLEKIILNGWYDSEDLDFEAIAEMASE